MADLVLHRTDAHALHALLTAVEGSDRASGLHHAWAVALDCEMNSLDFVKKHGEVVGLLNRTVQQIEALPDATRRNYERWIPSWWLAVVGPNQKWDRGDNAPLIDDPQLALLHALGDVIEANLHGSSASPGGAHIDRLEAEVTGWLDEVRNDPNMLPDAGLRKAVVEHLEHVVWLIENRALFGSAPVAAAAQEAVGAVVAATPGVPKEKAGAWTQRARQLVAALTLYNGLLITGGVAIEQTADAVAGAIQVVGTVVDEVDR